MDGDCGRYGRRCPWWHTEVTELKGYMMLADEDCRRSGRRNAQQRLDGALGCVGIGPTSRVREWVLVSRNSQDTRCHLVYVTALDLSWMTHSRSVPLVKETSGVSVQSTVVGNLLILHIPIVYVFNFTCVMCVTMQWGAWADCQPARINLCTKTGKGKDKMGWVQRNNSWSIKRGVALLLVVWCSVSTQSSVLLW